MARTSLAITAAGMLAVACSSSGSNSNGGVSTQTIPSFTFVLPTAPISLDITKDFDGNILEIMSLFTDPIEHISNTGVLSPNIATAVRQPNATTIIYTIRQGIRFSDGTKLTAADVAWSIQHVTDAAAGAETAGNVTSVASVTATGPYQVTVKLSHPDPTALGGLAVITFVQEKKFAEANLKDLGTPGAVPIGAGPYKVASDTTQGITLVRNPYYWGPKPAVAKLVFNFIPEDTTAQLAMRSGSIQGAQVSNLKTTTQWQAIKGATLYPAPQLESTYLSMDTSQPPFNNIHVRLAIAYGIDRSGLEKAAYGPYASVLQALVPAGEIYDVAPSQAAAQSFIASLPQYNLDLAKAKAELAESPYPHGFSVTVPYPNIFPWAELTLLNLQQNLKSLGIVITPQEETESQWIAAAYAHNFPGLQVVQITDPTPDPNGVLGTVVGQVNIAPKRFDFANWTTPQVEQALPVMKDSTNTTARWQATKTIISQIATQVPYIPLYAPYNAYVLARGYKFSKVMNYFDFESGDWVFYLKSAS